MIKTVIISLITLSGIGTSAMASDTIKPKIIEVSAGTLLFTLDENGFETKVTDKTDYVLRLKTHKNRVIAIRF